jgi:hypothetical protein
LGTILNNDDPPQIQFETGAYSVGEGAGTVVLTVTLTGPTALTATVQYATSDGPPPASATAGADYVAASDTLTFLPGQTQQTLTITVLDDSQPEANEFFVVSLSDATHSTLGDRNPATVRINDDDGYRVFLPLAIRSAQPAAKARAQPILGLRSSRR